MSEPGSVSYPIENNRLIGISAEQVQMFESYLTLLLRWNAKTNLTAIRDADGIRARHFLESIACAQSLPEGITTLLDFGSGAGFPGLPIAICCPQIAVTLAESQNKKASFLREAIRTLHLSVKVHAGRAEQLATQFDCVTLRAVDNMQAAIAAASQLVAPAGYLAVMTTTGETPSIQAGLDATWHQLPPVSLLSGTDRILYLARRI